jgi:hypothetical protein
MKNHSNNLRTLVALGAVALALTCTVNRSMATALVDPERNASAARVAQVQQSSVRSGQMDMVAALVFFQHDRFTRYYSHYSADQGSRAAYYEEKYDNNTLSRYFDYYSHTAPLWDTQAGTRGIASADQGKEYQVQRPSVTGRRAVPA